MKIGEKFIDNHDGTFVVQRQFNNDAYIERVKAIQDLNGGILGESRLAGEIPLHIVETWAKEAGIKWDDPAMKEVIKRKLLSGDFDKFRVWKGTF
jgi:hypothetical protein